MKANAPEKIYIPRLKGNETFVHEWDATKFWKYFSREIAENVEYTRTDAFIEKACEFWKDHLAGYDICDDDIERSVESFKLAMKI